MRNTIREDMLYFAIPALIVYSAGLVLSAKDGYDGLLATVWDLVKHPRGLVLLSIPNIVGLTLMVVGFTIALVALGVLRLSHASTLVIRENQQLRTRGIYHYTRHPLYLGVIIVCIIVPVYASSLYGLLAMSALIPLFLNRIRMEENLLIEESGDAYRAYRETTSKLVPFIY